MDERALVSIPALLVGPRLFFSFFCLRRRNCSRDQDGKVPTDNPFFLSFLFLLFNHGRSGRMSGVLSTH